MDLQEAVSAMKHLKVSLNEYDSEALETVVHAAEDLPEVIVQNSVLGGALELITDKFDPITGGDDIAYSMARRALSCNPGKQILIDREISSLKKAIRRVDNVRKYLSEAYQTNLDLGTADMNSNGDWRKLEGAVRVMDALYLIVKELESNKQEHHIKPDGFLTTKQR